MYHDLLIVCTIFLKVKKHGTKDGTNILFYSILFYAILYIYIVKCSKTIYLYYILFYSMPL